MKRILIADDERYTGEIIRHFIRENNLPLELVGETQTGSDTIRAIQKLNPDIVFLDIEMPGCNGLEVMEQTNGGPSQGVDFIIVTAYSHFEYAQGALRLGARDFLLKPIQYRTFCDSLMRVVGYRYSTNVPFNNLLEHLHANYAQKIGLKDCVAIANMSVDNIVKLFKKSLNTSFTSYLNQIRIQHSQELLAGGVPIKEAAARVGYHNLNYFYRNFKRYCGVTPKEYAERAHQTSAKGTEA